MPKVELMGRIKYAKGWNRVTSLVEKEMISWGGLLDDWTVRIRLLKKKEINKLRAEGKKVVVINERDNENKIMYTALPPEPLTDVKTIVDLIIRDFMEPE